MPIAERLKNKYNKGMAEGVGLIATGHGTNYHELFRDWNAETDGVRGELNLSPENTVAGNTRARAFQTIGLTYLAGIKKEGGKIHTDDLKTTKELGIARDVKQIPPGQARTRDQIPESEQGGNLFLLTNKPMTMRYARRAIESAHPDSYVVIDAGRIQGKEKQPLKRLIELADRQGKRVTVLHSAPGQKGVESTVLVHSKLLSQEHDGTGGEAAVNATLAGPIHVLKDYRRYLENPRRYKPREERVIRPGSKEWAAFEDRIASAIGQQTGTKPNVGITITDAGFGGDQAAFFSHYVKAHNEGRTGVKITMCVPDYWRALQSAVGSRNATVVLHWANANLQHSESDRARVIGEHPDALHYGPDPSNPTGAISKDSARLRKIKRVGENGLYADDGVLVDPNTTPESRLKRIGMNLAVNAPTLTIFSLSKTTENPGIKAGCAIGSPEVVKQLAVPVFESELRRMEQFLLGGMREKEAGVRRKVAATHAALKKGSARKPISVVEPSDPDLMQPQGTSFMTMRAELPLNISREEAASLGPEYADFKHLETGIASILKGARARLIHELPPGYSNPEEVLQTYRPYYRTAAAGPIKTSYAVFNPIDGLAAKVKRRKRRGKN